MPTLYKNVFMKKIVLPFLAVVMLFLATGCSTKFDVAAPYKNITVVYGLLDQRDTAHYIRIQKAFLDQNKNAVNMAQSADSSFYSSLDVKMELHDFNGNLSRTITLHRVDLNNEGYPKEAGAFFNSPNYAYKFTDVLDPLMIYRLKVRNTATGEVDSSEAPVIADYSVPFGFTPPFYCYSLDDSNGNRAGLDFANTGAYSIFEISGRYTPDPAFLYNGQTSPAFFVQAIVRFNWVDSNIISHQKTWQHYDYDAGYQNLASNSYDYKIQDISLYSGLAAGMKSVPNTFRYLDRAEILLYMGTLDFSQYLQANLTQGTGLTGSEIEPIYTNIKGANALGLFTSRAFHTGKLTITNNTIDSLMAHPLFSGANIKGTAY